MTDVQRTESQHDRMTDVQRTESQHDRRPEDGADHVQRTELTVKYSDDMQTYILAVDELRTSYVIPFILEVHQTTV